MMRRFDAHHRAARGAQRGASLVFALIVLVALMLAAIALVRSIHSGTQILGNIGLSQDATATAEIATTQAIAWLTDPASDLATSSSASKDSSDANGFYARVLEPFDATGQQLQVAGRRLVDWNLDDCKDAGGSTPVCALIPHAVATGQPGTSASYVIVRLCSDDGPIGSVACAQPLTGASSGGISRGQCSAGDCERLGSSSGQYFRIIVRVKGVRETVSFTETIVQY